MKTGETYHNKQQLYVKLLMSRTSRRPVSSISVPPFPKPVKEMSKTPTTTREFSQATTRSHVNPDLASTANRFKRRSFISSLRIEESVNSFETSNENTPISMEEFNDPLKVYISFDLLKAMNPSSCIRYLSASPLFLRTMFLEGKLDEEILSHLSLNLSQNELQRFIMNMTQEINIFNAVNSCTTFIDVEAKITSLMPIQRATLWIKSDHNNFIYSQSLKYVLPLDQSVVGVPFSKKDDYITGDPGNFTGFSITNDLPLLRGTKSMLLLPISTPTDETVAVLQVIGFKSKATNEQCEFSHYYFEFFKIVRDIIQRKFFSLPQTRPIPPTLSSMFIDIENASVQHTVSQISKFLVSNIPCEDAEVYEFDDRYRSLIRLLDGSKFNENEGGISYSSGLSSSIINVPHGQIHPKHSTTLDGRFANRSSLSKSIQFGREHYVITLRAKPNSPCFSSADIRLLSDLSPLICDAIKVSKYMESKEKSTQKIERDKFLYKTSSETASLIASNGMDRWNAIIQTAKLFFECDTIFLCLFDGRNMVFHPTNIKCRFEECSAGKAYNYREPVLTKNSDEGFNSNLYLSLKVQFIQSFSFPYRTNGKVSGSIEIINPKRNNISIEEQRIFGDMCGTLFPDIALQFTM